ncbi:MAG: RadC family protein [Candidatus Nanohaloarchaea archaeon]
MDYTVKDLPESERPREKLEQKGVSALNDVELLSIILRTGTQGKNVKELAGEILETYHLSEMADRPVEELEQFSGVSSVKAGQLKSLAELARRMKREEREKIECFSDLKARVKDMKHLRKERLRLFSLSAGNEILSEDEISGGIGSVQLEPREVFRPAMMSQASAVILAHNHPSGKAAPTEEDVETTRDLIDLGKRLGVDLLDHAIIGEDVHSMRASTSLDFGPG